MVGKALETDRIGRMQEAAFIGYQNYIIQPQFGKKKAPRMTFSKWVRMLGLKQESAFDRDAELAASKEAEEAVKKVRWHRS